jgi:hypothetical protein
MQPRHHRLIRQKHRNKDIIMTKYYTFQSVNTKPQSFVSAICPPQPPNYSIQSEKLTLDDFCKFQFYSLYPYQYEGTTIYPVYIYLTLNDYQLQIVRDKSTNKICCIQKPSSNPANGLFRIQFVNGGSTVAAIMADNNYFWSVTFAGWGVNYVQATGTDPSTAECQFNYASGLLPRPPIITQA